jgi:hypothetical protein
MPPLDVSLLCYDLPSRPRPEIGRVLVTGATGYIGGRLVPELLARGTACGSWYERLRTSAATAGPARRS